MSDDKHPPVTGLGWQVVALFVGIFWIASVLVSGIAGVVVCSFLGDAITPHGGKDSFFVQCCVTVGGVVGAIAGGYLATKLARALRRRYSRTP